SLPVLVAGLLAHTVATTHAQTHQPIPPEKRLRYQIKLALDFDNRAYTGTERVRFVNRGDHPVSSLFFHLYPNVRVPGNAALAPVSDSGDAPKAPDEPRQRSVDRKSTRLNSSHVASSYAVFGLKK